MGAMFIGQQFLQNVLGYATLDAGAAILPAAVVHGAGRAAVGEARRGAAARASRCSSATCSASSASSRCCCSGRRASRTGRSGSATRSSAPASASPARRRRTRSPVRCRSRRAGMASGTADLQRDLGGAIMQSILGALLTAGLRDRVRPQAIAGVAQRVAGQRQRAERAHEVVLERGDTAAAVPAVREADHRRRRKQSFVDGQDWAYVAGIIAIVLGAALVFFLFPKPRPRARGCCGASTHARTPNVGVRRLMTLGPDASPSRPVRRTVDIASVATRGRRRRGRRDLRAGADPGRRSTFYAPLNQLTDGLEGCRQGRGTCSARRGRSSSWCSAPRAPPVDVAWRAAPPAASRGASLRCSTRSSARTHSVSGVDVRCGDGPAFPAVERRDRDRAALRDLAVPRAPAAPHPRARGRRCVAVAGDVPRRRRSPPTCSAGSSSASPLRAGRAGARHASGRPSVARGARGTRRPRLLPPRPRAVPRCRSATRRWSTSRSSRATPCASTPTAATSARRRSPHASGTVPCTSEPGTTVFGSRVQQLEHVAYATLLAARAGVRVPELVTTGVGGPDAALLVTRPPDGHAARRARARPDHRRDAARRVDRSSCGSTRPGSATATSTSTRVVADRRRRRARRLRRRRRERRRRSGLDRDRVALLVDTALRVGHERAIAAAVDVLGQGATLGALIPLVQPAALPAGVGTRRQAPLARTSRRCRADPRRRRPAPRTRRRCKIKRLTLRPTSGSSSACCSRSCIAIPSLEGIDWRLGPERVRERDVGMGACSRSCSTRSSRCRGPPRSWAA